MEFIFFFLNRMRTFLNKSLEAGKWTWYMKTNYTIHLRIRGVRGRHLYSLSTVGVHESWIFQWFVLVLIESLRIMQTLKFPRAAALQRIGNLLPQRMFVVMITMYKGQNIQTSGWILYENEDAKKFLLFTSFSQVQILKLCVSYLGLNRKPYKGYLRLLKLKLVDILSVH